MSGKRPLISRRTVLTGTAAAGLAALFHEPLLAAFAATDDRPKVAPGRHLLRKVRMRSAADFGAIETYYCEKLGFPLVSRTKGALVVMGGAAEMTFVKSDGDELGPLYHFAFNIPQNKLMAARDWMHGRIPLIDAWGTRRDPKFPKDVIHFPNWNAHSLFFWDPAYNIVELIARHDLDNDSPGKFTRKDVLYQSEIAFAVDDQDESAHKLHDDLGLAVYPPGRRSGWWSMGDENGLILCTQNGRSWGDHTDTPRHLRTHPVEIEIAGDEDEVYKFQEYPFEITVKSL